MTADNNWTTLAIPVSQKRSSLTQRIRIAWRILRGTQYRFVVSVHADPASNVAIDNARLEVYES